MTQPSGEGAAPDVVVVGGGPVGLVASLYARRAGYSVVVVEPRAAPVDKACGEGLMPSALGALQRLGVDPPGRDFVGIRYLAAQGRSPAMATARFPEGPGRGVRRTQLHQVLQARAAELGVVAVADRVVGLPGGCDAVQTDDGGPRTSVQLSSGASLRPRWVLAADGLHSPTRRSLGLDGARSAAGSRYGLRAHFRRAPWSDLVEVSWSRHAEAYVTPVADDLIGVALLGPREGGSFDERLSQFPVLLDRLAACDRVGTVAGAGPLRQRATALSCGRILLVGDAAGYVDALTGEGLSLGITSARLAVDCIVRGRPDRYAGRWRVASRRTRWLTEAMVTAAGSRRIRPAVVPAARYVPGLFRSAVRALA